MKLSSSTFQLIFNPLSAVDVILRLRNFTRSAEDVILRFGSWVGLIQPLAPRVVF